MKTKFSVVLLVFVLLVWTPACKEAEQKTAKAIPPVSVSVYKTLAEDVPIYHTFVGQIYGAKDIAIRARVEGFLKGVHFKEGSPVKSDDLLYTIESQTFEAQVASMKGLLAEANTKMVKAKRDLDRYRPLAKMNAVSQSDLDGAVAAYDAAKAGVTAAQANVRAVQIQMGYTKVYSPINGIIGKTKAKVGDFVGRDPNPVILNTVSNTNSVLAEFFLTESQYLGAARHMKASEQEGMERENAFKADIQLILADGSVYPYKGKPNFLDRQIDPTTGAILMQVSFPNPDGLLRPGQFAKIKAMIDSVKGGVLVPQRCITDLQGLKKVFVVGDGGIVKEQDVSLGPDIDNFVLVKTGLSGGESIVYEGLQKVADGTKVTAKAVTVDRIAQEES
ncbi:efflux RND transporter periplasmic adaptor subunit [Desulfobacter hydrogenophilus]|uniref:Efflux RND transporter periplasmic adaptor subunit n=1 Tax=Desulfobacter hydrogenophilus TaxID=2291 RepID=A0A328FE15_9BACT|nr:efflux RND transporter periplasmic adaptor subunit [Desulfobacter hydrogenophilus]NDY71533.1 efflux RND transporter periplasmic adaptor subunit [Desulfobacter hydrogenophilus]QBH11917.1 efflux RND transporter periplasmic adaptor subunit [Desulfobacter hydrogenophilus]RAM02559.1 efflux RND transporter periplasmic adaptor subunit [Desulfobacter hydrogenophilus]